MTFDTAPLRIVNEYSMSGGDSGSFDSSWNESVSGENDKEKSGRDGNKRKMESDDETAVPHVAKRTYEMELVVAVIKGMTETLVEVLLPHLQGTTAVTDLRPIRLQKSDASYDIMPLSLSETMESLLKRAQDDKNHDVFRNFTKEETAAFQTGKKLLYVKLVKKGYLFEKRMFTPFSVKDVYKMTDDDPLCLRLYIIDKKSTVSDVVFF